MEDYLLTHKILTYDDVLPFSPGSSNEPLVDVVTYDSTIRSEYLKQDMLGITGEVIYVRDAVAQKLAQANKKLALLGYVLKVAYGYRHPDVQKKYFLARKEVLAQENPGMDDAQLNRLTHNFVAVPDIAGHPTGGAVDISIAHLDGTEVDMGTTIADYTDPLLIQTFDARASAGQLANRMILHDALVAEGLTPFYGEWWHFSYGDREWAAFYHQERALYGSIEFSRI